MTDGDVAAPSSPKGTTTGSETGPKIEAPDPSTSGKRTRWTRRRSIMVGIAALVAVLIILGAVLGRPLPSGPSTIGSEANTRLYETLASGGLNESLVDITSERVLVRYNLDAPVDAATSEWALWFTVGAVYSVAPQSERLVIQEYHDLEPVAEIEILMDDIESLVAGSLTEEEFESRMQRTSFA